LKDLETGMVRRRHRRHRNAKARKWFLVMLLFAATAAVTWQFSRQRSVAGRSHSSPYSVKGTGRAVTASTSDSLYIASRPGRPAYAYSVIPGGIESAEELRQISDHDPVVAQEFQGFDYQNARLVTVSEEQLMYVAYRKGDKVYWTRKKVPLHPGETLITDGKIVARTRCGNRVAVAPLGPPSIMDPLLSDFDQPLFSNEMVTNRVEPQPEAYAAIIPNSTPEVGNALRPARSHKGMIPLFFVPLAGIPGGSGGSPHTPLAVAPEPGTLLLLTSGLAGVYLKSRKSRRKQ
jgi:hypothetical protein